MKMVIKTSLLTNISNVLDKPKMIGELLTYQLDVVKTTVQIHIQNVTIKVLGIVTMLNKSLMKPSCTMIPMLMKTST